MYIASLFALVSLLFGVATISYGIGSINHPGPGLFPLIVSGILFVISAIKFIRGNH